MNLRRIALSNLRRRKSRAAFLVIGLAIGVATVVALLTLSHALRVEAQNNLEHFGANIVVTPQTNGLSLAYGGVTLGGVSTGSREIREATLARIKTIPNARNIATVAPELLGAADLNGHQALLMGVRPAEEFRLKQWWSLDGRAPRSGSADLVVGSTAASAYGLARGQRVVLGGRLFTVTGVLKPTGSEDDNLLIADLGTVQGILHKPGQVTMLEVAALCSACPVAKIVTQLRAILPGTTVTAMQQIVTSRMHALDQFRTFSYGVAAVIIVIEALVVFITMMGSVNARTREIGIFRALGFRREHVTGLILIEAAVASLVAGGIGYLAGLAISFAVLPLVASGGAKIAWSPLLGGGAIALATVIGGLASVYPAMHASRLDPTDALRAI
jgi:putative ABC transport system permease protein